MKVPYVIKRISNFLKEYRMNIMYLYNLNADTCGDEYTKSYLGDV